MVIRELTLFTFKEELKCFEPSRDQSCDDSSREHHRDCIVVVGSFVRFWYSEPLVQSLSRIIVNYANKFAVTFKTQLTLDREQF